MSQESKEAMSKVLAELQAAAQTALRFYVRNVSLDDTDITLQEREIMRTVGHLSLQIGEVFSEQRQAMYLAVLKQA